MSARFGDAPAAGPAETGSASRGARAASAAVGAALLAFGVKRRSLGGLAAVFVGGWLLYRGVGDAVERMRRAAAGAGDATGWESGTTAVDRSHTVTVDESAEELYERWRDPETQTRVFGRFATVTAPSEGRLRWEVEGPFGRTMTWESRVVEERPGELLRWESVADAAVTAEGSVRFRPAPGDRGTEVTLQVRFEPPGGAVGGAVAERLGVVPETLAATALYRFKSLVEAGEIPTLEGNPSGRGRGDLV